MGRIDPQTRHTVRDQVWDQVLEPVWIQIGDRVRFRANVEIRNRVMDQVVLQFLHHLRDQAWENARNQFNERN
jgi:predicted RNA-binding protein (virulence factor B family)